MKKAFIGAVAIFAGFKFLEYDVNFMIIFGIASLIAGIYILVKEYLKDEIKLHVSNESNDKNTDAQ